MDILLDKSPVNNLENRLHDEPENSRRIARRVPMAKLRPPAPYSGISGPENEALRLQNEYFWENSGFE
jgi:hypothetical protein